MISKELIRGMIKPIVLYMLQEEGKMYGYEITRLVRLRTDEKVVLTLGALYPVLHKMEAEGDLVTTNEIVDNRLRKYYSLSGKGKKTAGIRITELIEFVDALHLLFSREGIQ